jgi:hypothetical protein
VRTDNPQSSITLTIVVITEEPKGVGERNWSLWGEINQKQLRPQDQPLSIKDFAHCWPKVIKDLYDIYPNRSEVKELFGQA